MSTNILYYHGISTANITKFNWRFTDIKSFEKQLIYLKKNFTIIPSNYLISSNYDSTSKNVVITFDDCYLNWYTNVLPLVEKHEIPVTFFTTPIFKMGYDYIWTDFVDVAVQICFKPITLYDSVFEKKLGGRYFDKKTGIPLKDFLKLRKWESKELCISELSKQLPYSLFVQYEEFWKVLSEDALLKLSQSKFVEIGSHGLMHNNFSVLNEDESILELKESKNILESITQKEVLQIAYPDGSYNETTKQLAENAGFKLQHACKYLFESDNSDNRIIDRIGIYSGCNWLQQLNPLVAKCAV